jgi:WD40 repeat protein
LATIFISYARKNLTSALDLKKKIEGLGHEVWLDLDDLPAASRWRDEIAHAVEGRDVFLFALSPASAGSHECRKELDHALEHRKRIVPVVLEDVPPGEVSESLADINWIRLRPEDDQEAGCHQLDAAIATDLDHLHQHTRFLTRALEWERARRDRSLQLRGGNLVEAEQWLAQSPGKKPVPTELQQDLIRVSRQGENRRRVWQTVVAGLLAAISLIALWVAYQRQQTARAALSRQLARDSISAESLNRKLLLAVAAQEVSPTGEAASALLAGLEKSPQLLALLHGHTGDVAALVFHPREPLLASAGSDGAIHLWNTRNWTNLATLPAGSERIESLAFTSDGQILISGDQAGQVRRWNPAQRKEILPPLNATQGPVDSLSVHPGRRYLGVGYLAGGLLWDLGQTPPRPIALPVDKNRRIPGVSFDPTGRRLAALEGTSTLLMWDFADGTLSNRRARDLAVQAAALAWSPGGETLVLGHSDGSISWIDAGNLEEIRRVQGPGREVLGLAFDGDGSHLATGYGNGEVRVWNEGESETLLALPGQGRIFAVAFQPGTGHLASAGTDSTVYLFDPGMSQPLARQALHRRGSNIQKVVLSPEGRWLIAGSLDGRIARVDLSTRSVPGEIPVSEKIPVDTEGDIGGLALAGDRLLWSGAEGLFGLWDLKSQSELLRRRVPGTDITAVAMLDDSAFAIGGKDGRISLWRQDSAGAFQETPLPSEITLKEPPGIIMDLAFSPDGRLLAAGDNGEHVLLWDTASRRRLRTWAIPGGTTNLAFSPDSRQLAVVNGGDGLITLLDPHRNEIPKPQAGDCTRVFSVTFREKGRFLITGCDDGSLEQLEISPWRSLGRLRAKGDFVYSLAPSQDTSTIAAGTADGRVLVWDIDEVSWKRRACRRANEDLPADIRNSAGLRSDVCRQLLRDAPPDPPGLRIEREPEHGGIPENVAGGIPRSTPAAGGVAPAAPVMLPAGLDPHGPAVRRTHPVAGHPFIVVNRRPPVPETAHPDKIGPGSLDSHLGAERRWRDVNPQPHPTTADRGDAGHVEETDHSSEEQRKEGKSPFRVHESYLPSRGTLDRAFSCAGRTSRRSVPLCQMAKTVPAPKAT